jgi:hypothetical protein
MSTGWRWQRSITRWGPHRDRLRHCLNTSGWRPIFFGLWYEHPVVPVGICRVTTLAAGKLPRASAKNIAAGLRLRAIKLSVCYRSARRFAQRSASQMDRVPQRLTARSRGVSCCLREDSVDDCGGCGPVGVGHTDGAPQIPPLRFASVGMTTRRGLLKGEDFCQGTGRLFDSGALTTRHLLDSVPVAKSKKSQPHRMTALFGRLNTVVPAELDRLLRRQLGL